MWLTGADHRDRVERRPGSAAGAESGRFDARPRGRFNVAGHHDGSPCPVHIPADRECGSRIEHSQLPAEAAERRIIGG